MGIKWLPKHELREKTKKNVWKGAFGLKIKNRHDVFHSKENINKLMNFKY